MLRHRLSHGATSGVRHSSALVGGAADGRGCGHHGGRGITIPTVAVLEYGCAVVPAPEEAGKTPCASSKSRVIPVCPTATTVMTVGPRRPRRAQQPRVRGLNGDRAVVPRGVKSSKARQCAIAPSEAAAVAGGARAARRSWPQGGLGSAAGDPAGPRARAPYRLPGSAPRGPRGCCV
jgi:hypothetical protein